MAKRRLLAAAILAAAMVMGSLPAAAGQTEAAETETAGTEAAETEDAISDAAETDAADVAAAADEDTQRVISVSATGTVMETPDMAQITFSISTEGTEAASAQSDNADKVNAVMDALTGLGVKEDSIQTSDYNISPEYDYSSDPEKLTGYQVRTTLTVSDQKISETGKILSECVKAGVNDVDSVVHTCSTYDEKYQEALTLAVKEARQKAETLAAAEGAKVGKALTITEGYQDDSARYQTMSGSIENKSFQSASADTAAASSPQLSAGSLQIQAEVSVVYQMK